MKIALFLGLLGSIQHFVQSAPNDHRVVGGQHIPIEQFPYQVSIRADRPYGRHICGATIVSDTFVVTAAQCVDGSSRPYEIRAGSASLSAGGTKYRVERVHVHPNYSASALDYDIAVLKINHSIEFNNQVQKINLIAKGQEIGDGFLVDVVGWGVTSKGDWSLPDLLQSVRLPVLSEQSCAKKYAGIAQITSRHLCAGTYVGGYDSCQGDSGGGLTYNGTLAGIVSFGLGCARPGYPGVYSRIATLRPWMESVINSY